MKLTCAGPVACNLMVGAEAPAQDVSFEGARNFAVAGYPTTLAVGDFNADGRPDLAAANWYDSDLSAE